MLNYKPIQDLSILLDNPINLSWVLGEESQSFQVHKSILIGRSDVFAAMLGHHETMETSNDTTIIKDIGPGPLKEMLRFLYTDKVHMLYFADILIST
jgi:hypothetical protein